MNNQTVLIVSQQNIVSGAGNSERAREGRVNGQIDDAAADFANEFRFKDYGIGLEFHEEQLG